ncbi:MAG: hypothetical protein JW849_00825 [Phycisphaerae bacterium]|nr:hypothetical protein [Phycisphaerae bacterium]
MANLKDKAISLLASGVAGMQTSDGKTTLYTVPAGKKAVVTQVVVRQPTASLAGGTSFSLGDGANADTWKTAVNLSTVTGTDDYFVVTKNDAVVSAVFDAGDEFGVKPVTGATANADATLDVFGYEFNV